MTSSAPLSCIADSSLEYGEDRARDESLESNERNAGGGDGRKLRTGIVGACHANDFGIGAAAADLDPVVVKQLDGNVAVGEQFDVVVEFARWIVQEPGFLTLTAVLVRMA